MAERIQIGDQWYVAATSARSEENPKVLKHDRTFVLFDRFGDIQALAPGEQGLYHDDTRFLSHQALTLDGARPLHLGASTKEDNSLLVIELMNPDLGIDLPAPALIAVPKGTLHLFRAKLLWQGRCYEHLRLTNHGRDAVGVTLGLSFEADFVDLFEVRGMKRPQRGERLEAIVGQAEVTLPYRGRDGCLRRTRVCFDPQPATLTSGQATFLLELAPAQECHLYCTVVCEYADGAQRAAGGDACAVAPRLHYERALRRNNTARGTASNGHCALTTSNPLVNLWLDRSASDLAMLMTDLPTGPYPYAGVPWYATTFGRDGLITARECLWRDAAIARGVLAFLASTQAQVEDPAQDAEPGKILHEARRSEMARTGEIPFGRYYGTVDATPLFVALAGAYYRRTADADFIRAIWPNVLHALAWIDGAGDCDGDGFVEYARRSDQGLVQQGWKDSQDSVFHGDGELAQPPIALCEVQAYVYEAKLMAADLALVLDDQVLAQRLFTQAADLKRRFAEAFWCDDLGMYALALDGRKRPCRVASSNAGHALWTGIASQEHAQRLVDGRLFGPEFYSGWGIRTIASGQARYNPMSYHNGSVWPHDNALIAIGLARYGYTDKALRIFSGLFDASLCFDQHRLPELFCGFARRTGEGPTLYPVACSPQAWAAAAVFGLLQACLGLDLNAEKQEIALHAPRLPTFVDWLEIRRLRVGKGEVDLLVKRYENNVGLEVTRKQGEVGVRVEI
ncbi:MAG: amylo-alpha-1,6-glucosidase [Burkholderiales bacterium]|nr:amylo-alpha-1,6-glucosidase [Burkholderiales bacterium]